MKAPLEISTQRSVGPRGLLLLFSSPRLKQFRIKILDADIERGLAGLVFFVLLTGSFIQIARGLSIILHIQRTGGDAAAKVAAAIRLNTSVGNPFSESLPRPHVFLDSIGIFITVLLWFLGSRAGLLLFRSSALPHKIGFSVYCLYALVGIWIGTLLFRLLPLLSSTKRLYISRIVTGVASFLIGFWLLFFLEHGLG